MNLSKAKLDLWKQVSATVTTLVVEAKAQSLADTYNAAAEAEAEDNDYCPICETLTNTKSCAWSRTCWKCEDITFCDDCGHEDDRTVEVSDYIKKLQADGYKNWICERCDE